MSGDGTQSSIDDFYSDHEANEANGDESNNVDHSSGYQGSTSHRFSDYLSSPKVIIFDEYGRPVDIESEKFATAVGKITKTHCPPAIDSWKKVPQSMKEDIERGVNNKYVVREIYKAKVLEKANISWKNWKSSLRKKCDMYPTIAERKRNRPINIVKKEDWEDFVDFCSTPEDKIRREVGREARKKVRVLHITGRTGCARVAHKLKKESPTGEVNRSMLYVTTHMPKNTNSSTSSNDYVEKIRKLVEDDPYLGQHDLDNDPVAMVLGRDRKGYVRGMGGGVLKTKIRASAASREIARQLKNKNEAMETDIITLKEEMATIKEIIKSNPPRTSHQSSPSIHGTSEVHEQSNVPKTCFLKDFKRKHVAFGRLNSDTPPKEDVYNIIVDEIFDRNAYLFEGDGKFENIMLGDLINWPKESVQFIRI